MKTENDKTFRGISVQLDDARFINCKFKSCEIHFSGGVFETVDCLFDKDCVWRFRDAALRTMALAQGLGWLSSKFPPLASYGDGTPTN